MRTNLKVRAMNALPRFNPITVKELSARMRGARAYTVLTIYLAIVSAMAMLLYLASFLNSSRSVGGSSTVGTVVFYFLVGMQIVLVSFIAPAFTTGAISGERERETFDLLRSTILTPRQIVFAKLISALGYTLLLIFATLPLFSLAFLLGGIEPMELFITLCVILASALLFSLLGLFVSARVTTSVSATVITYALVLGIVVGVPLVLLIGTSTVQLALSPITSSTAATSRNELLLGAVEVLFTLIISLSPIGAIAASQRFFAVSANPIAFNPGFVSHALSITLPSPYLILTALYLIASAVIYVLTVRRVAQADRE
jgi:ABC-type transport system involved in multi-copper enzyme maturation permease subunit